MTDIYTVIFTSTVHDDIESIPWVLSFADLELAKNHVREEAGKHAADLEIESQGDWDDREGHSTFVQKYGGDIVYDTWLITRTELVEENPSGVLTSM